jgi:hypothetical protein
MTPEVAEATPEHSVAQLFSAAGIKRLVCVDDVYAAKIETLLETLAGFTPEQRASVFDVTDDELAVDQVWQQRVRDEWGKRDAAERASLVDTAYAIASGAEPLGTGALHALRALLPSEVDQIGLSLSEWRSRRDVLIGDLAAKPTLILFDQDFSHEGSGAEEGQRMIVELETQLRKFETHQDAYYGLLTNTVTVDQEHERRQQIVKDSGADPARLVVMSKRNLDDELGRFAMRLRTTLLAPILADLLNEVTGEIENEQKAAIELAKTIPPDDLERMVVRSSDQEGVWPADTLLRILEVMQRAGVRESLRLKDRVVQLTERLRLLADVTAPTDADATDSDEVPSDLEGKVDHDAATTDATNHLEEEIEEKAVWGPIAVSVFHKDIYDTAEHVNGLHLPIELGDLFERGNGKRFVVVAQPCDLMVREKGIRMPELSHMLLAEIADGEASDRTQFASFELPYYNLDSGTSAFVKLGRPWTVRAMVLDACVLNDDGRARLSLDAEMPLALLPHWRTRREELHKVASGLLTKAANLPSNSAEDLRLAVGGSFKRDPFVLIELDQDTKTVAWDCTRVGRVRELYARALLARFSQYFARDAYLHDMGRE